MILYYNIELQLPNTAIAHILHVAYAYEGWNEECNAAIVQLGFPNWDVCAGIGVTPPQTVSRNKLKEAIKTSLQLANLVSKRVISNIIQLASDNAIQIHMQLHENIFDFLFYLFRSGRRM